MTIYTCDDNFESILTCIYEAWSSRKGHQNIKIELEKSVQYTLFDEYIHVEADSEKADKVIEGINLKISTEFFHELEFTSLSHEKDVPDNIYRVMILGFALGSNALNMVQYREICRNAEIRRKLSREIHGFREFIRFHRIGEDIYAAHIEPKSRVLLPLGVHFQDRMPSENWIIVDDTHKEAFVHPKSSENYIRKLTEEEYRSLLKTEDENDSFTDLWKIFYDSIAIEKRENDRCRKNLFPLWMRKHAVEFIK